MSWNSIKKGYFPYTNKCGADGVPCWNTKCKFFIEDKRCWNVEFDGIINSIFKTEKNEGPNYYYFRKLKDDQGFDEGLDHIYVSMPYSTHTEEYRETGNIKIVIWIQFNSLRLAEKIQKEFDLNDWEIEGHNWEGGDDHVLCTEIPATYDRKPEIIQFLKRIRKMVPQIIASEKKINNCDLCKEHSWSLNEYKPLGISNKRISICHSCEMRIIGEHIAEYAE